MAEICCGVVSESETSGSCEPSSRVARRRRMEIRRFRFVAGVASSETENGQKRQKLDVYPTSFSRDSENAVENCALNGEQNRLEVEYGRLETKEIAVLTNQSPILLTSSMSPSSSASPEAFSEYPKFGVASVCGRRRDMEDAVAIHPSFCRREHEATTELHYFGVYDGHGCSHVAMKCRDRLHELVKEELESPEACTEWKKAMERSFCRMDKEVIEWDEGTIVGASCRCELQTPECDAVGSTAVVAIVTPDKIIVANCGDSRAVLSRNGKAVPLSSDHKVTII